MGKYELNMRGPAVLCIVIAMATGALADGCDCEDRIAALEAVVNSLGRESCQTGDLRVQNCDSGFENINNVILCVNAPINGGSGISDSFTVNFPTSFSTTPVVDVSLSGQAVINGQNQSVSVSSVTGDGFTINYEADDFIPVTSDLTWFACPGAALSPSDPDLGPDNGGSSGGDSRRR